jgi:hypothetical protein
MVLQSLSEPALPDFLENAAMLAAVAIGMGRDEGLPGRDIGRAAELVVMDEYMAGERPGRWYGSGSDCMLGSSSKNGMVRSRQLLKPSSLD